MGVEVGVDFVKEVEGGGVALLDCEDEGEGAETWTILIFEDFLFLGLRGEIKKGGGGDAGEREIKERQSDRGK